MYIYEFLFVGCTLMLKPRNCSTMARCAHRASDREGVATGNMLKTELP